LKAISLWQPWASLMAVGAKCIETRHWPTAFRGELAICTAKRRPRAEELSAACARWVMEKLGPPANIDGEMRLQDVLDGLPRGKVVCVVNLHDCVPTEAFQGLSPVHWLEEMESDLGNYGPERFAWLTSDCRRLREPTPVIGRQGLWNLPADVEARVRAQL
jgi:hypothetical protein